MIKHLFLVLLIFYSITAFSKNDNFELKGLKIGESLESVNTHDYECSQSVLDQSVSECRSLAHVTIANKEATIKATLYQNKIDSIIAFFHHDDYEDIKNALLIKYGKPYRQQVKTLTNGFGAEFLSLEIKWIKPNTSADLTERVGSVDSSILSISTKEHINRYMKKIKKEQSENANDL